MSSPKGIRNPGGGSATQQKKAGYGPRKTDPNKTSIIRKIQPGPNVAQTTPNIFGEGYEDLLYVNDTTETRRSGSVSSTNNDDMIFQVKKAAQKKAAITLEGGVKITSEIEDKRDILCVKYDEEYQHIAGGFPDGTVNVYNLSDGEVYASLLDKEVEIGNAPVTDIVHRPPSPNYPLSNTLLCSYANGSIKCWNTKTQQCNYTIREKRQTFGVCYHRIQPKFITFGDNGRLYLYDEETKTQERIFQSSKDRNKHDGHESRVFAACFHPRNQFEFVSGGWDDTVQFWDMRQPHAIRHISAIHICGKGIDVNTKGTEMLLCAWQKENPLQIYDYSTGKLITVLEPDIYNSKLYCGAFAAKDFAITGGTEPNMFRLIDLQTHMTHANINNLPTAVYALDVGHTPHKKTDKEEKNRMADLNTVPKVAFVSGKKIYQVDFQ